MVLDCDVLGVGGTETFGVEPCPQALMANASVLSASFGSQVELIQVWIMDRIFTFEQRHFASDVVQPRLGALLSAIPIHDF